MKTNTIALVAVLAVVLVSGCTGTKKTEENMPAPDEIIIKDFKFVPAEIVVSKGTTITWRNQDSAPHTATSAGNFDSGRLGTGDEWNYKFENAGTFEYICTLHPYMKGKVIVE